MPGPQNEKLIRISDVGDVIDALDLTIEMQKNRATAHSIFSMKSEDGDTYSVMYIDGLGIGVASSQSKRVFIMEGVALIVLARLAGIDEDKPTIIVPAGVEVPRG